MTMAEFLINLNKYDEEFDFTIVLEGLISLNVDQSKYFVITSLVVTGAHEIWSNAKIAAFRSI